jgi:hypothetical protein
LLKRCLDVAPHLYTAIDAIEADLGITGEGPAAQRKFSHDSENVETSPRLPEADRCLNRCPTDRTSPDLASPEMA